jgi:thioredoxin-related protein
VVQDYFREHFMIFAVDIEGDVEVVDFKGKTTTMKDLAFKQYRVRATPVFAFFDLDGNYIKRARFTGATRDKDEFMLLGRYVVDQAYKKQSFTRYKRSAR